MPSVIVIGAGISGLATAFRIRAAIPGVKLTILERADRAGGNVGTDHLDGFTVERGPNGFLDGKRSTLELCHDLGLKDQLIVASEGSRTNRFLYQNGEMFKLPASPSGILRTPVLSLLGKLKLLTEPFRGTPKRLPADETIEQFASRRFGKEVAATFMDALVTGIHGGDPAKLSVAAAFPRLPMFERETGSVIRGFMRAAKQRRLDTLARGETPGPQRMWSFRGGLRTIIDALAEQLGDCVKLGVDLRHIEKTSNGWLIRGGGTESWSADAIVVACPAHAQAELLTSVDEALATEIAAIGYTPVHVVAISYKREHAPLDLDGFGYIAPQRTRRDALGVQWCSSIFPDRAPPGYVLWRVLCGGMSRPDVAAYDDETLLRCVHAEMKITMGVTGEPAFHKVVRWPRAIPQYLVGHLSRVERIETAAASHAGLFLGGNAYRGIAMNDCTERAGWLAESVARFCRLHV